MFRDFAFDGGDAMSTSIQVINISGATIISVGENHLPMQSFIGDWENGRWGDGKFPGIAAVAAVATLRLGATLTDVAATRNTLTAAADELTTTLGAQIATFVEALNKA
jgi:hypothetical protein